MFTNTVNEWNAHTPRLDGVSEIERLAAALREAREVRRGSEGAMQEAECALSQAIGDEFSAKAALDKAVAKLVSG